MLVEINRCEVVKIGKEELVSTKVILKKIKDKKDKRAFQNYLNNAEYYNVKNIGGTLWVNLKKPMKQIMRDRSKRLDFVILEGEINNL